MVSDVKALNVPMMSIWSNNPWSFVSQTMIFKIFSKGLRQNFAERNMCMLLMSQKDFYGLENPSVIKTIVLTVSKYLTYLQTTVTTAVEIWTFY